jgi:glycosyltransferase involved in cell wall biosynthesis
MRDGGEDRGKDGRLRILMFGPFPEDPDRVVGGVEAASWAIAQALSQSEAVEKVLAVYIGTRPIAGRVYSDKLESRFVQVPFINGDSLIRSWFAVQAVRKLVGEFKPHVVHGQGIGRAGDVMIQQGLPAVVTVHGMLHQEARVSGGSLVNRLKAASLERVAAAVLAKAQVVISISEYDAKELGPMIKGRRVSIPNAVPDAFFEANSPIPAEPVVVFAGLMRERKNVLGLVNAFIRVREAIPDAKLVIAGPTYDEAYRDLVLARVREAGIEGAVSFLGHVSSAELIAAVKSGAALALFSREETLPTIIAQAMAVGRPVVAADVGGIKDMVAEGETGFLVPSEDEAALADRLIEVLTDKDMAARFGARGPASADAEPQGR